MLLGLLMVLRLGVEAQQRLVMPAALKAGDTIAVVSPSSTPDSMTVVKGCQTLREWGFVPVVGPHALSNWHGFAGTADERAADMLWALRDSTVKAILCSRGGDGAVQVLQRIALNEFYNHPKWVMGFSDATALHSAEVAAGVMSIHCSMCDGISLRGERDSVNAVLRRLLQGELPLSIGGGIGQSRLCMVLLHKGHIGEIQASIWPEEMRQDCKKLGMNLI